MVSSCGFSSDVMVPPQRPRKRRLAGRMEPHGDWSTCHPLPTALDWPEPPVLPLVLMVLIYVSENSQGGKEARKQQPVVILLGWGGCRDKNLAKYSAIYHKRVSTAGKRLPGCHLCGSPGARAMQRWPMRERDSGLMGLWLCGQRV